MVSGCSAPGALAAPKCRGGSPTGKGECLCTPCGPISTTASAEAKTTYGRIGVKVWIYKGDILPYKTSTEDKISREAAMAVGEASGLGGPRRVVSAGGGRRRPEMGEPGAVPAAAGPSQLEPLQLLNARSCLSTPSSKGFSRKKKRSSVAPAATTTRHPTSRGISSHVDAAQGKAPQTATWPHGGMAKGGTEISFGDFGVQALEPGWISARQIEAARIAMTRHVRRGGKVWIRVFPDKPVTAKPAETRMGSGKGNPEFWVAVIRPGRIMFELAGVSRGPRAFRHGTSHPEAADKGPLCDPRPPGRGRGIDDPPNVPSED